MNYEKFLDTIIKHRDDNTVPAQDKHFTSCYKYYHGWKCMWCGNTTNEMPKRCNSCGRYITNVYEVKYER